LEAEFMRWDYGTVVVDLTDALTAGSKDGDLWLRDGDRLEIPAAPLGVRVFGAVNHAGEVAWLPDQKLSYYLSEADGVSKAGWKNRAVVIKARNGSQIRYQPSLPIDPGDVIYVPSKPETTNWDRFKDIVGVVAQVATLVLIGQNLGK
jgi:protein involved in polysaccharide export with SLBB domain